MKGSTVMRTISPVGSSLVVFLALALLAARMQAAEGVRTVSPLAPKQARIDEIAAMLSQEPCGIGRPISDRGCWGQVAKNEEAEELIAQAEQNLGKDMPVVTKADFDSYAKTGRRERFSRALGKVTSRYKKALFAECIENKGRFVADIEKCIRALCELPTWVPPYHNGVWVRKEKEPYVIDLYSVDIASALATGDYWLGEKISKPVRCQLYGALAERIFDPVRDKMEGKPARRLWWLERDNNWNSVCNAGVVITAISTLSDRQDRAYHISVAENSIRRYLDGFTDDGYCSEGLGYWNYGFSNYVKLADAVFMATGGKLDWMADAKVRLVSLFGTRVEVLPGVYPAIADVGLRTRPNKSLQNYISRKYSLGLGQWQSPLGAEAVHLGSPAHNVFAFPAGLAKPLAGNPYQLDKFREWFGQAQFYVGRPGTTGPGKLGIACKGGHNDEHHNHNDVGTYVIAVGQQCPLIDPGGPVYTKKTFSSERYTDDVINSWGHAVPLVAGKRQETGAAAQATVIRRSFSDAADTLVFDMKAAYQVPALKSLTRTFVYDRAQAGSVTIADEVTFSEPSSFGTAMITYGKWQDNGDGSVTVTDKDQSLRISIDAAGQPYRLEARTIDSEVRAKNKPTRIGIDLAGPVLGSKITLRVTPEVAPSE